MSEHARPERLPGNTRAAEGLPRRRWSVAEIEAMAERGIIRGNERSGLVGGEVVPMSPKSARHETVKKTLQQHWVPLVVGTTVDRLTETTLYVSRDELYQPDFLFWPLHRHRRYHHGRLLSHR